jgi:hypothetical protein
MAVAGRDRIIAAAPENEVAGVVATLGDLIVAFPAIKRIETRLTLDDVVTIAAQDRIIAATDGQRIVAGPAIDDVRAAGRKDAVIAVAARDRVVAIPGVNAVIA